jgi:hypothetical protein
MADLSLRQVRAATMPFMGFVDAFHSDVVKSGLARRNEDGSITTVFSTGVPFGDKIYEVPGYDPSTGGLLTEQEAIDKYLPLLESGELQKQYGDFGVPKANYGTVIELYQELKRASESYKDVPLSAVKFDLLKKPKKAKR